MTFWFWRGLRRGVVTTSYPAALDRWTATLPTPPTFFPDLLTTALVDRLSALCPAGALERQGSEMTYDVGACTACGRCLVAAGAAARPSGELELAATARRQLVKRVPIRAGPA